MSARLIPVVSLVALSAALALAVPATEAADGDGLRGGPSTPNANVVAVHTGASPFWFVSTDPEHPDRPAAELRLTLNARTDRAAVPSAQLLLEADGLEVLGFEVHRVAVGDTECGGTEEVAPAEDGHEEGVRAVVRGVGVLASDGDGLAAGEPVQVWVDLDDRGEKAFGDRGRVRIRPAPHQDEAVVGAGEHEDGDSCSGGGEGGWTYDTRWMPMQQVIALARTAR